MFAAVLILAASLGDSATALQTTQSKPVQKEKPKIVVFTFCGGFKHDALALAEETIKRIGDKSGAYEATLLGLYKHDADKLDLSMITPAFLAKFDGIVFYTTSGERDKNLLTEAQRKALMDAIEGGTAFIGIHSATDTFYKWPEYGRMIGAYFDGHPWSADAAPVTIKIEDRFHPATREIGGSWFLQEEIYQHREPYDRAKLHVLMSLDAAATDMTVKGIRRTDRDFAIAWTKLHGRGRVFYTALGHREEVWRDELFQQHLLGGIRWALGLARGKPFRAGDEPRGIVALDSGLRFQDLEVGTGPVAREWHDVVVNYVARLEDGTVFDSTEKKGRPFQFMLGRGMVIRGWEEGIVGMRVGGKRKLFIPPHLAYGAEGSGDLIPPNANLIFEVELLDVRN